MVIHCRLDGAGRHSLSEQSPRDRFDSLWSRAKAGDRLAVALEFAVREIADVEVGDTAEGGAGQLGADILLAAVRCNQEQPRRGVQLASRQREVEHPDDARLDRCTVLDLKRRDDAAAGFEPEDVDQPDRIPARSLRDRRRQTFETAVAERDAVMQAPAVVRRHPDVVAQGMAEVAEPHLDFGMAAVDLGGRFRAAAAAAAARAASRRSVHELADVASAGGAKYLPDPTSNRKPPIAPRSFDSRVR